MIKCVLRYASLDTLLAKLAALGIPVQPERDTEGAAIPLESRVGRICTPELIALNGDRVITIVLAKEEAAKLPDVSAPDFLCDWRSDEVDEDGNLLPWPEYEIPAPEGWPKETVSEDGKTTTPCAYRQGAGRISGE